MEINKSVEDYLEAVLMVEKKKGWVRAIDVGNLLGFTKPSVCVAVKNLCSSGHLVRDEYKCLHLTETGREIAERVYDRHRTLEAILVSLGVDRKQAEQDACKIEHDLSEESYRAIRRKWLTLSASKEEVK